MTIDLELTLKFGFYRISGNTFQCGPVKITWWKLPLRHGISFGIWIPKKWND